MQNNKLLKTYISVLISNLITARSNWALFFPQKSKYKMPKNLKWPNDVTISAAAGWILLQQKDVKRNEKNQDKKLKMENESAFNS